MVDADGDGMVTIEEMANVKSFYDGNGNGRNIWRGNKIVYKFNELQYFTGLTDTLALLRECSNLIEVKMPAIPTYDSEVLAVCTSLKKVVMPEGVVTIGTRFIERCTSLQYVEIPSTIKSIGGYLGGRIDRSYIMVIKALTPPSFGGFSNVYTGMSIYVPDNSVTDYQVHSGWSAYAAYIHPLSEYAG